MRYSRVNSPQPPDMGPWSQWALGCLAPVNSIGGMAHWPSAQSW